MSVPAEYTANTTATPVGVTGKQRQMYLSLNESQRRIYRYHFDICGRLAAHCYQEATA